MLGFRGSDGFTERFRVGVWGLELLQRFLIERDFQGSPLKVLLIVCQRSIRGFGFRA